MQFVDSNVRPNVLVQRGLTRSGCVFVCACACVWVQVRPKTINKGVAVELLLRTIEKKKPVDFVLCVGDDRSDEVKPAGVRVGLGAASHACSVRG